MINDPSTPDPSSVSQPSSPIPSPSDRLDELLKELLDSGATPEEVCGTCPELLPTVRNQWRQMCRLRADLDALFPPALSQTLELEWADRIS